MVGSSGGSNPCYVLRSIYRLGPTNGKNIMLILRFFNFSTSLIIWYIVCFLFFFWDGAWSFQKKKTKWGMKGRDGYSQEVQAREGGLTTRWPANRTNSSVFTILNWLGENLLYLLSYTYCLANVLLVKKKLFATIMYSIFLTIFI